jgi:hypothetical protein
MRSRVGCALAVRCNPFSLGGKKMCSTSLLDDGVSRPI